MENDKIYLIGLAELVNDCYCEEITTVARYDTFSEAEDMVINHPDDIDDNHTGYDSICIIEVPRGPFSISSCNNVVYELNDITGKYEEIFTSGPINRD